MATLTATLVTKTSVELECSGAGSPTETRYWTFTCNGETIVKNNKKTSASCTFTGLKPGKTYKATCRYGPASDKTKYNGGTETFTTNPTELLPSGTASLKCVESKPNSLKIEVSGIGSISATRTFYWYLDGRRVDYTTGVSGSKTSDTYTFTGLSPETKYYVEFQYKRTGDEYDTYYVQEAFTTKPDYKYSLSLSTSATHNTISATVTLDEAVSYDVDCSFTLDGARTLDATIPAGQLSRTRTWTTDIKPATGYTIGLKDNLRNLSWTQKRRTKNNFSWSTKVQQGIEFNITASDWNDFTDQLSSKASYYGITYSPATMQKGYKLTAERFNNIVATINKLVTNKCGDCVTKMSSVSVGDPVTAELINDIAICLNE